MILKSDQPIIRFNEGTKYVSKMAFSDHKEKQKLSGVVLPESIEMISPNAFKNMFYTEINIPEGVKYIGQNAFRGTRISKLVTKNTVFIGANAFQDCILKSVDITCMVLEDRVFSDCSYLEKAKIRGIHHLPEGTFDGCRRLEELWVPECDTIDVRPFQNAFPEKPLTIHVGELVRAYCNGVTSQGRQIVICIPQTDSIERVQRLFEHNPNVIIKKE